MGTTGSVDDRRTAVGISVTTSGQISTASLTMLPLVAGAWFFVLEKCDAGPLFKTAMIASGIAFVVSTVLGGKGVTAARDSGFDGNWTLPSGKDYFNGQAMVCLLGFGLFCLAIITLSKPPSEADRIVGLQKEVASLKAQLNAHLAQPHPSAMYPPPDVATFVPW